MHHHAYLRIRTDSMFVIPVFVHAEKKEKVGENFLLPFDKSLSLKSIRAKKSSKESSKLVPEQGQPSKQTSQMYVACSLVKAKLKNGLYADAVPTAEEAHYKRTCTSNKQQQQQHFFFHPASHHASPENKFFWTKISNLFSPWVLETSSSSSSSFSFLANNALTHPMFKLTSNSAWLLELSRSFATNPVPSYTRTVYSCFWEEKEEVKPKSGPWYAWEQTGNMLSRQRKGYTGARRVKIKNYFSRRICSEASRAMQEDNNNNCSRKSSRILYCTCCSFFSFPPTTKNLSH